METFYQVYLKLLGDLVSQMEKSLDGLPQEAVDWTPGVDMNSIGVLAAHSIGATRFLICDLAGDRPTNRDRAAEFMTRTVSADDLKSRLQEMWTCCQQVLESFRLEDLDAQRTHPANGRELTVGWCLAHALEHFALHLGHMEITRQVWEMQNV